MSQKAALQALDAEIFGVLGDVDFADTATYTPPGGGTAVPVQALKDDALEGYGDDPASVAGQRTTITLLRAEVPDPQRGATVTVGSDSYQLAELDLRDDSISRWVVVHA